MRLGSIFMFALAVVFGIIAVVLAQSYIEGQTSFASNAPDGAVSLDPKKTIVVANKSLRFGTELTREHLTEIEWLNSSVPSGAFASIDELITNEGRRVVLRPIEANEPVLSWKVTGPGARATLSAVVDEGKRAVSVPMNDVLGVAGFVLPGDRVDILLTRRGGGEENYTDVLLQNIKILAINQLADERAEEPSTAKTVTVEVDSVDAQKLALAQTVGTLSLMLRSAGSMDAAAPRRISLGDLGPSFEIFADGKEDETPSSVDGLANPAPGEPGYEAVEGAGGPLGNVAGKLGGLRTEAIPFDPNARVGVTRGMERQEYRVPKESVN